MPRPDTSPLRVNGLIVADDAQRRLDDARSIYRRAYNRGYSLSERGDDAGAQRILDNANAALRRAETIYEQERKRGVVFDGLLH